MVFGELIKLLAYTMWLKSFELMFLFCYNEIYCNVLHGIQIARLSISYFCVSGKKAGL